MKKINIGRGYQTIVDDEDYPILKKLFWTALTSNKGGCPYALGRFMSGAKVFAILMHRFIDCTPDSVFIDHINRNGLDNRKSNLRRCTTTQNLWNVGPRIGTSSKYKGVMLANHKYLDGIPRWKAFITSEKKLNRLGTFKIEEDAARAYDKKARIFGGEFAYLNFPSEHQESQG